MLAATDRREIGPRAGDLSRVRTSRSVFRSAYRELCTRIWLELELLTQAPAQPDRDPRQDRVMSTEILRLELLVLVDQCRSPRWRCLLSGEQRDRLCSMLTDVLAALYVEAEDLGAGIEEAQDRLLDELLPEPPEPASGPPGADQASGCGLAPDSHCAVNELVRLLEARAAARARWPLVRAQLA